MSNLRNLALVLLRLEDRCSRAEEEYPRLAAPDGTVAVPFTDLRIVLDALSEAIDAEKDRRYG